MKENFSVGDKIWIKTGHFQGHEATIKSLEADLATVLVAIFGRINPVDVELSSLSVSQVFRPVPRRLSHLLGCTEGYVLSHRAKGFPSSRYRVRLEFFETGSRITRFMMRQITGGGWESHDETTFNLKDEERTKIADSINAANFWNLPEYGGGGGLDGFSYELEGVKNCRYHRVSRWLGGEICDLGDLICRLARINANF